MSWFESFSEIELVVPRERTQSEKPALVQLISNLYFRPLNPYGCPAQAEILPTMVAGRLPIDLWEIPTTRLAYELKTRGIEPTQDVLDKQVPLVIAHPWSNGIISIVADRSIHLARNLDTAAVWFQLQGTPVTVTAEDKIEDAIKRYEHLAGNIDRPATSRTSSQATTECRA